MRWEPLAVGAASSVLLILSLASKWKLPKLRALGGAGAAALVATLPFWWVYPLCHTGWGLAAGVCGQTTMTLVLFLSLIMLCFCRDPERTPPEEDGVVLSAADGEVLYIRTIDQGSTPLVTKQGKDYLLRELMGTRLLEGAAHVIGVEMSHLDVHVNRCPVSGQIRLLQHIGGKFISLRNEEAPFVNERLTTVIEGPSITVSVVQVASRLIRRVESYVHIGETVAAGQRLGTIRLGSLVAVVLPKRQDVRIEVRVGDRVTAGVSILARYGVSAKGVGS